jgi:type II secretory pathway component PulL
VFGKAAVVKAKRVKTQWASIDLADDGNVIVCVKSNGAPCCIRFDSLEQLKQAIDHKKISAKKWAVAVPRSSCILKKVTLPASDMNEAAKMIEFELPSLVPLSPDEFVYGCTPLNQQENMLNVLVCILKLSVLEEFLKPYRAVGIQPHRIAFDSLAINNWFNIIEIVASGPLINILANKHKGAVQMCVGGNLQRVSDLVSANGDVTMSSSEIVEEILNQQEELPALLKDTYEVLIAGVDEYALEVKNLLSSKARDLSVSDRISIVPNPRIDCYEQDGKCVHDNNKFCFETAIAAGLLELAANSKHPYSNLLPQQYIRRQERRVLLGKYLRTAVLSVVLLVLVWLCLAASSWRIERLSSVIESQIVPIEQVAGGVDSKRQRVVAIRRQLSNRGQIAQVIGELYEYTPKTISISEFKFVAGQNGASVEIKGQADSLSAAFDYTDAVLDARLLCGIQIENAQQVPRPGGSVVTFKAYCDIPSGNLDNEQDKK